MSDIPDDWLWIVIVGFIVSFLLAFGIGANDVANSFGTSVGSKVLTLLKACILATIFEILGAVLIGYRVSDTIRKGIIDVEPYNNSEKLLLMGNLSALTGSCIWLFLATFLSLPVSATHSIVGATIGFSLVAQGPKGVGWVKLGMIVGSWFVSPLMSGIITTLLFVFIKKLVLTKAKPLEPGLRLLPLFYGVTILINGISVFLDGSELLHFDKIPLWGGFILSFGLAIITAIVVRLLIVPWMRKRIGAEMEKLDKEEVEKKDYRSRDDGREKLCVKTYTEMEMDVPDKAAAVTTDTGFNGDTDHSEREKMLQTGNGDCKESKVKFGSNDNESKKLKSLDSVNMEAGKKISDDDNSDDQSADTQDLEVKRKQTREGINDQPQVASLFSFLQILTAVFGSFAHGGNDVSNAIGPLVALWVISNEQSVAQKAPTPIWILVYGGAGISVGLWILGRRVIKTMGEDLSKITPTSGFCIELGAAITVLIASNVGIPISTTHCKVGSIVFVGRVRSNDNVDWSLFRNIFIAWVVTLPISGLLSALMMFLLKEFAL